MAASTPPISLRWERCRKALNDATEQVGVLVQVGAPSPEVRGFEVSVKWRGRFLGLEPIRETRLLVHRQPDGGDGFCFVATGGEEAWLQVQAWALIQRESIVENGG